MGGWLELRLHDPGPNRDGIGAIVEARIGGSAGAVRRLEVTVGGGHGSGQLGWIHVGLGASRDAEIRVRWPDGQQGEWMPVAADQFLDVTRGVPAPVPWSPSPS
jgi:hypothetical protein